MFIHYIYVMMPDFFPVFFLNFSFFWYFLQGYFLIKPNKHFESPLCGLIILLSTNRNSIHFWKTYLDLLQENIIYYTSIIKRDTYDIVLLYHGDERYCLFKTINYFCENTILNFSRENPRFDEHIHFILYLKENAVSHLNVIISVGLRGREGRCIQKLRCRILRCIHFSFFFLQFHKSVLLENRYKSLDLIFYYIKIQLLVSMHSPRETEVRVPLVSEDSPFHWALKSVNV